MTEEEIIEELEKANNQPLDYVQVLIYDHGPNAAPYETWVDVAEQEEDLDDEDCCDGVPLQVQNMSDLLIDLRDGFNLTRVEYKVLEEDGELPVFVLDVVAVPTVEESNITDDVMDKFMEIISNDMEK
ncbi:MAG: hypothetical protein IIZ78_29510 [Clostridiales bacterium]|nr:hypothetical protein [Clostridiales bacterium]MBQ1575291.1 hypothetical protein [Clostridiales bacterium]